MLISLPGGDVSNCFELQGDIAEKAALLMGRTTSLLRNSLKHVGKEKVPATAEEEKVHLIFVPFSYVITNLVMTRLCDHLCSTIQGCPLTSSTLRPLSDHLRIVFRLFKTLTALQTLPDNQTIVQWWRAEVRVIYLQGY